MRISLIFNLSTPYVSFDYRRKFISFFKKSLEKSGGKDKYYPDNPTVKDYTFSVFFNAIFNNGTIEIKDKMIILNFSIREMKDGIYFMNAFMSSLYQSFPMGNKNSMTLKKVQMHNEKELNGSENNIKILSPIVVKERDNELIEGKRKNRDKYYTHLDPEWINVLKDNMKFQLKDKFDYDISYDIDNLIINLDQSNLKRTVVTHYDIKFPVTIGTLHMTGNKELLKYFLLAGIGSRRPSGFGMLELI